MKKVFMIINFLLFFTTLSSCYSQSLKDLNGEIIMTNPNIGITGLKDFNYGILIYSPKNNNFRYVEKNTGFTEVSFSENKERILGLSDDHTIVEYNIKTKDIISVYKGDEEEATYDYLKYVPKTDYISFMSYPNLYMYNRKTKERILVTQAGGGEYSWSKNGKKLFYSIQGENKIYCLDMDSKTNSMYIKDGFDPQLSGANDYIAFHTENGNLTVKEIKTGKEWFYKGPRLFYYKFSPDDKYLAIIEEVSYQGFGRINLIAWDFKNNKKIKLIENIYNGSYSNFDWK